MLSRAALCVNHQALSRVNVLPQRIAHRSMHLTCRIRNIGARSNLTLNASKYAPVLGACVKRYSSTNETATTVADESLRTTTAQSATVSVAADPVGDIAGTNVHEGLTSKLLENIPDAPVPPTIAETVSYVGEPPLSTLGLGGWTPPGIVQQGLELLHVSCGLPWWEAIAIGTVVLRLVVFPLVVKIQRNNAIMCNNMPQLSRLQAEMSEAKQENDQVRVMKKARELVKFMKENNCNPFKNMILPLIQAPVFLSVFLGLRKMAEMPVESMKQGGLWWFTDLTSADPYYILPVITAATLAVTIEIGTDSSRAQTLGAVRYAMRALPIIILPFTINFPAAILCYWVSTNFVSLLQVGFLRIPKVRTFFKIELLKPIPPTAVVKTGFIKGVKTSIANMKTAREMNARYVADQVQFHRAGRGPVQQTFSYDPTKELLKKPGAIMAKKR